MARVPRHRRIARLGVPAPRALGRRRRRRQSLHASADEPMRGAAISSKGCPPPRVPGPIRPTRPGELWAGCGKEFGHVDILIPTPASRWSGAVDDPHSDTSALIADRDQLVRGHRESLASKMMRTAPQSYHRVRAAPGPRPRLPTSRDRAAIVGSPRAPRATSVARPNRQRAAAGARSIPTEPEGRRRLGRGAAHPARAAARGHRVRDRGRRGVFWPRPGASFVTVTVLHVDGRLWRVTQAIKHSTQGT